MTLNAPQSPRTPLLRSGRGILATLTLMGALACQGRESQTAERSPGTPGSGAHDPEMGVPAASAGIKPIDYIPPSDSSIPNDALGVSIRRGRAIFMQTTDSLPGFAPGKIQCTNCHIDGGRRLNAAPLLGVHARFPKYMDRTGAVIPLEDRVNYCFTRSMSGSRLPTGSREMQDIIAYLAFISTGVPVGGHVKGEGMPKMPRLTGDSARGAALYQTSCVACHGPDGQGTPPAIPALWGPGSYSIGASMAREERAASFIRHFMPLTSPGSLTDQQAYDLSAYINSHPRPDSPGKALDWPDGGAPSDVPYDTKGHRAYRPPSRLIPRRNAAEAVVPSPPSVSPKQRGTSARSGGAE